VQPAAADVTVGADRVEVPMRVALEPILAGIDLSAVDVPPVGDVARRRDAMPAFSVPLPLDGTPVVLGWAGPLGDLGAHN
jgi:hypothetical protein